MTQPSVPPARRRSSQRIWVPPLMLITVVFLAYSLPPYLGLDPSTSRIAPRAGYPLHYPLLVGHILFGTIALVTGCFQVWPWFRTRFRTAHRRLGRAYFFAGTFPAGILVLGVSVVSSTGFVSSVGNTVLAILWLVSSAAGYRAARQRRYADHRVWMIRSFALTTSIVFNRLWVALFLTILTSEPDSPLASGSAVVGQAAGAAVWASWVANLLVAEWWLIRPSASRPGVAVVQASRSARASR